MYSLSFNRCIYPHNKDIEHFHSKGVSSLCNQSPPQYETSTHLMPIAVGWFCLLERHRNILLITMRFFIFIHVVACISSSEFFSLGWHCGHFEQDNSLSWRLSCACGVIQ